jgi:ligand-binding sensor domain-containing protein
MIKYCLRHSGCLLLSLFLSFTSCNGQSNTQPQEIKTVPPSTPDTQPKLLPADAVNRYASVFCSFQDRAGNMWFGTSGLGIYRYDPLAALRKGEKSFINFTEKDGLSNNNVWAILEDKDGKIWMATSGGVCIYDPSASLKTGGKSFTTIPISAKDSSKFDPLTGRNSSASLMHVWTILLDKTGRIWLSTDDGVYVYTEGQSSRGMKGKLTHFLDHDSVINNEGLKLSHVASFLEDRLGNIWITTWFEGLCCYDGKSITRYKPNGEVWFSTLLEDKKGNIWVGRRDKGVFRYDPSATPSSGEKRFVNMFTDVEIFNSCGINTIKEDESGNIWFGTEFGNGAWREEYGGAWCYDGKTMKNFTVKDGLSHNCVASIKQDKSGKIWFGTRNLGLCCYDPSVPLNTGGKIFTDYSSAIQRDDIILIPDGSGGMMTK